MTSLTKGERQIIFKFVSLLQPSQLKLLLDLKTNSTHLSDIKLKESVLPNGNQKSYAQLKTNCKDTILGIVIALNDFTKFDSYRATQKFRCQKKILIAHFLYQRGIYDTYKKYIRKAEKIAKDCEFLNLELQCLQHIKESHGTKNGYKVYGQILKRELDLIRLIESKLQAQELYKSITLKFVGEIIDSKSTGTALEKCISKLSAIESKSGLLIVTFWIHMSKVILHYCNRNFDAAINQCRELLRFISKHKWLSIKANIAGVNMQIGTFYMCLGDTEKALYHLNIAKSKFKKGQYNQLLVDETMVQTFIHSRKLAEAKLVISKCLKSKLVRGNDIRSAKWYYYFGVVDFLGGKFNLSLSKLKKASALKNEKSGWNIGWRLLELILIYEKHGPGYWGNRLENFERTIRYVNQSNSHRPKVIARVMRSLQRNGFDFARTKVKTKKDLELLKLNQDEYFWDPTGFELFKFDRWFDKQIDGVSV